MGDTSIAPAVDTTAWSYDESLERAPESAAVARHLVSEALRRWRLSQLSEQATLIVTELVSNAVTHATGEGMRVSVRRVSASRVRVAVIDRDRTRPQLKPPTPDRERGRGLLLVHALSDTWGVDLLPGGKRVWAECEAS